MFFAYCNLLKLGSTYNNLLTNAFYRSGNPASICNALRALFNYFLSVVFAIH